MDVDSVLTAILDAPAVTTLAPACGVFRRRPAWAYAALTRTSAHDHGERGSGAHPARAVGLGGRGRRVALWLARPAYALYTRRLRRHVSAAEAPRHLAVILDGNRRWALGEGLREAGAGHRQGADKIDELLDWCAPLGIEEITVWALSNENLGRPDSQLTALFDVVCDKLDALEARALVPETAMRLRVIGRVENLPERVSATIRRIESSTAAQPGPSLTIALGYSGRDELIDACKALVLSLATEGVPAGAHRRRDHARVARGPPLHRGRARPRSDHPYQRGAAAERIPALAERPQRAVLHGRLLAGIPRARPAARAAHLPAARPAPRSLANPPGGHCAGIHGTFPGRSQGIHRHEEKVLDEHLDAARGDAGRRATASAARSLRTARPERRRVDRERHARPRAGAQAEPSGASGRPKRLRGDRRPLVRRRGAHETLSSSCL